MSLDNKIKNTFNPPPSLEGEDWLIPSDSVLDGIEDELYGESKKERKPFLFWLLPGLLLLTIITYLAATQFFFNKPPEQLYSSAQENNTPIASPIETKTITVSDTVVESNEISPAEVKLNNPVITEKQILTKSSKSPFLESKEIVPSSADFISNSSVNLANNFSESTASSTNFNQSTKENEVLKERRDEHSITSLQYLQQPLRLLEIEKRNLLLDITASSKIQNVDKRNTQWLHTLSIGQSSWNYKLNDNYISALQPADFESTSGDGYFIQIGFGKQLTEKFTLSINTSIDQNTFSSGHNSQVNYEKSNEMSDQSNDFDLDMASPIGFLQSRVNLERTTDLDDQIPLTVDLDNSHKINSIDLDLIGRLRVLRKNKFEIEANFGMGLNYISGLENKLEQFSTSTEGYISRTSSIVSDQTQLNKLRPKLILGTQLGYNYNEQVKLGISINFQQDLNPIYQNGDFNSMANRMRLGLFFTRGF